LLKAAIAICVADCGPLWSNDGQKNIAAFHGLFQHCNEVLAWFNAAHVHEYILWCEVLCEMIV
jgi:hypothetical protein